MTTAVLLVLIILGLSIAFFVFEVFTVDKTAFFILVSCMLVGVISPEEAISGFSNPAVFTILCLMILATAMEKNQVIAAVAQKMDFLSRWSIWLALPIMMILVGFFSSFVSTTAVVIVFITLITTLSEKYGIDKRKFLMPVSFAGILGGSCTLMGTSTNLLVNDIAKQYGVGAFGLFDNTFPGVVFFVVALPIIAIAAILFLPKSQKGGRTAQEKFNQLLSIVKIPSDSAFVGKSIGQSLLNDFAGLECLELIRSGSVHHNPGKHTTLKSGDVLVLMSDLITVNKIRSNPNVWFFRQKQVEAATSGASEKKLEEGGLLPAVHELLVLPNSSFVGETLRRLSKRFPANVHPLALKKHQTLIDKLDFKMKFGEILKVQVGDRILVSGTQTDIEEFTDNSALLTLDSFEGEIENGLYKKAVSIVALLTVVLLAAFNVMSILQAALLGVSVLLFTGTLNFKDAYQGINWQVIFLLAGMIPLGIAIKNTGTDDYIATNLTTLLSGFSGEVVLSLFFFITMIMSGFVSNNATAIIIAPIAISIAAKLSLPPKPFLFAIMFAANFSFFTPIGYQTNALIYGMGIYKFRHFVMVGGIVSLVVWLVASFLLPYCYF